MYILDSRVISPVDRFVQCFTQPGRYRYGFAPLVSGRANPANTPFTINVKATRDGEREGKQHDVIIGQDCGRLSPDKTELDIEANDVVCWSPHDANTPGFSVSGYSETDSFSSAAMSDGALYAHAFGSVGVFDWEDANGRRLSGTVRVIMPPMGTAREIEAYRERLAKAPMVRINGEKAEPSEVEVVVGGVVYFIVEQAEGISITDCRMISEMPVQKSPDSVSKC